MIFRHNTNRIEAFSDAVFAFAATLLMISLSGENEMSALTINWINFISFFVSFFVLVLMWKSHYNFFRRTEYVDNWIITFNSVLLFSVLYFVFPLKSMLNSMFRQKMITMNDMSYLFELYGVGILVIFLCLSLMYYRAYQKDTEAIGRNQILFYAKHFSVFVIVALCSILLSFGEIGVRFGAPGFLYALLGPLCYLNSRLHFKNKVSTQELEEK